MIKKLRVRRINTLQLSKDMRFSMEIHDAVREIDHYYKPYWEYGLYLDNDYLESEGIIAEENYPYKRAEQLEKAKKRLLNYSVWHFKIGMVTEIEKHKLFLYSRARSHKSHAPGRRGAG